MSIESGVAVLAIIIWIAAQYGLAAAALDDLRRGGAARAGNPVAWALVILCLPVAGPLLYFRQAAPRGRAATRSGRPDRRAAAGSPRRRTPLQEPEWPWDDDPPEPPRGR